MWSIAYPKQSTTLHSIHWQSFPARDGAVHSTFPSSMRSGPAMSCPTGTCCTKSMGKSYASRRRACPSRDPMPGKIYTGKPQIRDHLSRTRMCTHHRPMVSPTLAVSRSMEQKMPNLIACSCKRQGPRPYPAPLQPRPLTASAPTPGITRHSPSKPPNAKTA